MNRAVLCLLLATAALASESLTKWKVPSNEHVSVLSDANFQDFIFSHRYVMVMFTSPECPHCKAAHPEYAYLAKKFEKDDKQEAVIAELDVVANPKTAQRYNLGGYPTYKFFFHGIPIDYNVDRTERHMNLWIKARVKDRAVELTSLDQYEQAKEAKLAAVLYMGKKNKRLLTSFNALAATFVRGKFYYTYMDEIQAEHKVKEDSALILLRGFDDGHKVLSMEDLSYETMLRFYNSLKLPLVAELTEETGSHVFGREKEAVLIFAESEDSDAFRAFKKVADSKKFAINFARADPKSTLGKKMAELVGLTPEMLNQVRLLKFSQGQVDKYRLDQVTEDSLAKFLTDYKAGHLKTYLKSDKPAPKAEAGAVQTVVGENFEQLVFSSTPHVFLMVYSEDCKHCEEVKPKWEQLASKVRDMPNLVIARMNGATNEHPALEVKHYPVFKLYPKGDKGSPIDFKGRRSLKEFATFLERHVGSDWRTVVTIEDDSL